MKSFNKVRVLFVCFPNTGNFCLLENTGIYYPPGRPTFLLKISMIGTRREFLPTGKNFLPGKAYIFIQERDRDSQGISAHWKLSTTGKCPPMEGLYFFSKERDIATRREFLPTGKYCSLGRLTFLSKNVIGTHREFLPTGKYFPRGRLTCVGNLCRREFLPTGNYPPREGLIIIFFLKSVIDSPGISANWKIMSPGKAYIFIKERDRDSPGISAHWEILSTAPPGRRVKYSKINPGQRRVPQLVLYIFS
jgi:hypothetical protein